MNLTYKQYFNLLKKNLKKIAKLKYLLIFEKDNNLNFIEGSGLEIIANEFQYDLTPEETLNLALKRYDSSSGILYELTKFRYKVIAKSNVD